MNSLDAADLPQTSFLRDSTRRYQGLSYNCTCAPEIPKSRPLPPRRDSAIATSLRFARALIPSKHTTTVLVISLEPFTVSDIPFAISVPSSLPAGPVECATTSLLSSAEAREARHHAWTLAPSNPFAQIVKAVSNEVIMGAAGFFMHEVGGLQWMSAERKASAKSIKKGNDDRLADTREEFLKADYDMWHVYLLTLSRTNRHTSTRSDMVLWGLSKADEDGKRIYVQASPTEKAMYENLGFEVKRAVKLPTEGGTRRRISKVHDAEAREDLRAV